MHEIRRGSVFVKRVRLSKQRTILTRRVELSYCVVKPSSLCPPQVSVP